MNIYKIFMQIWRHNKVILFIALVLERMFLALLVTVRTSMLNSFDNQTRHYVF